MTSTGERRRLRVLLSAYACEPDRGSEPSVGWNTALALAQEHDVWVLTRANNRAAIERGLAQHSVAPRFAYVDLPAWARGWKRAPGGVALYYALWQRLAYRAARRLHREIGFDLTHHVTFVTCSVPSLLVRLPVPFIWGPVAGSDPAPASFVRCLGWRGRAHQRARGLGRWLSDRDPLVRRTARGAALALATTEPTAARLRSLGARDVRLLSQVAIAPAELAPVRPVRPAQPFRVVSAGRLLPFKAFDLGLRAFARARLGEAAEYWIAGDGPERAGLERLARELGIASRVHFPGALPRERVLELFGQSHALVHPSLHESGGLVCCEAMAMGCPVLALDLGGPALQLAGEGGFRIRALAPEQAVADLAQVLGGLAADRQLWLRCSAAARARADTLSWSGKAAALGALYRSALERSHALGV